MSIAVEDRRYITDLHFDHQVWINSLNFYKEELIIFNNRLAEIIQRNSKTEVTAEAEHFQNQFIRQKEVIDILLHDINKHESHLSDYAKNHPVAIEHQYFKNHTELIDRVETFEKLWKEMRHEYMTFLRKWM
jgi:hypothetical protein